MNSRRYTIAFPRRTLAVMWMGAIALILNRTRVYGALQGSPVSPPPSEVAPADFGTMVYQSSDKLFQARVYLDMDGKSIRVRSYKSGPAGHLDKKDQVFPVRYWPTAAVKLSDGSFCVAGKGSRNGNTIVELWQFDPPSASASPWKPTVIRSVDEIYSELTTGRSIVTNMVPMWGGSSQALLMKFYDSKDVYSLTLAGAYSLVASQTSHPNVQVASLLSETDAAWARELVGGGYVYCFLKGGIQDLQTPSMVLLIDSDKNGTIDSATTLSGAQFVAAGYDTPSAWIFH